MGDAPTVAAEAATPRRRSLVGRIFSFIRNCLAVIGAMMIVYHLCFEVSVILSPSMSPTLNGMEAGTDNDWVLTEKVSYWFRRPRRFEIVRFRNEDGIDVMKRVGGLPGETIAASEDGFLAINGERLGAPKGLEFLHYYGWGKFFRGRITTCGDGYFVLGDYSKDSQDSRYEGPIKPSIIRGRAWLIVWPPRRMGLVR